jgi:hypothetical protein
MKTFVKYGYTYDELNENAKENAKQWYLDDPARAEFLYDDFKTIFKEFFPRSDLDVCFSLASCQGDGVNIYGKLNLYDFLDVWNAAEKEKRTLKFYIDNSYCYYHFEKNRRYCYSCKFIDNDKIEYTLDDFISELERLFFKNINRDLIEQFFSDMIEHFEKLDYEFENDGYKYLYEADDDEISDACAANEWYFDENGDFISGYDSGAHQ